MSSLEQLHIYILLQYKSFHKSVMICGKEVIFTINFMRVISFFCPSFGKTTLHFDTAPTCSFDQTAYHKKWADRWLAKTLFIILYRPTPKFSTLIMLLTLIPCVFCHHYPHQTHYLYHNLYLMIYSSSSYQYLHHYFSHLPVTQRKI